jgi:methyl-accepting chemotaxis protein
MFRLSLYQKILLGFMVPILTMIIFATYSIKEISQIKDVNMENQVKAFKRYQEAQAMKFATVQIQQWLTDISATRGLDGLNDGLDEAKKHFDSFFVHLNTLSDLFLADGRGEESRSVLSLGETVKTYYEVGKEMAQGYIEGGPGMGNKIMGKFDGASESLQNHLNPLLEESFKEYNMAVAESANEIELFKRVTVTANGISIVIVILLSFFLGRSISLPINRIIANLSEGAKAIYDHSQDLLQVSNKLAGSSNEQSAAAQETVSAISEMTSMISQTSEFTKSCEDLANKIDVMTKEGGGTMEHLVSSMELIQDSNVQLQEMSNIIEDVSKKTNVINDIVFKTQLLSFNASIEAARAGAHGKGFAVVAEEVGNLANMSGKAAKEISSLLDDSQKQVKTIVDTTQVKVQDGQKVTKDALKIFSDISQNIEIITEQIKSIAMATKEQSEGVKQTSIAIEQMDSVIKENSETSNQAHHNSSDLESVSSRTNDVIQRLKILVMGNSAFRKEEEEIVITANTNARRSNEVSKDQLVASLVSKKNNVHATDELDSFDSDKDFE